MITERTVYTTSVDDKEFDTEEKARQHELQVLENYIGSLLDNNFGISPKAKLELLDVFMKNKDELKIILEECT